MEKLCIYGCGRKALYQIKNGNWICEFRILSTGNPIAEMTDSKPVK